MIFLRLLPCIFLLSFKPLRVDVSAESAILMNADTGAILYEKNSHTPRYPASITKIATAAYALKMKENDLDREVTADAESIASISSEKKKKANYKLPAYWVELKSSHIGIKKGEVLSLRALLYGMMLPSANDASNVIAQYVSGTIPQFIEGLNGYVKSVGCRDTHFCNPHGLHHPDHITTAYDMAQITKEALKNKTFREIVSTVKYARPTTNKQESTTLVQHNRLLKKGPYYYERAIGVKTGYTSDAQHTFVGAATYQGRTLIAVVLRDKEIGDVFKDSIALFDAAFSEPKVERTLITKGKQKYSTEIPNGSKPVETYTPSGFSIQYYPSEEPIIKALLVWEKRELPIDKDEQVGHIEIRDEKNQLVHSVPLLAVEEVNASHNLTLWIGVAGVALLVVGGWLFLSRRT